MKIILEVDEKKISETLHQLRELKDSFLDMTLENKSPAEDPEDAIWHLRTIHDADRLVLDIIHSIERENEKAENE